MKGSVKVLVLVCALALTLGLVACSKASEEPAADEPADSQAVSVMEESTQQGVLEATGIDLPAPDGAQDVEYFVYRLDIPIAEVRFTLNGTPMFIRAQPTDLVDIPISAEAVISALEEGEDVVNVADISGLYYSWQKGSDVEVVGRPAQVYTTDEEGGVGVIMWVDVVPGLLYNLGITQGATEDLLVQTAETSFVPVQGDVG